VHEANADLLRARAAKLVMLQMIGFVSIALIILTV